MPITNTSVFRETFFNIIISTHTSTTDECVVCAVDLAAPVNPVFHVPPREFRPSSIDDLKLFDGHCPHKCPSMKQIHNKWMQAQTNSPEIFYLFCTPFLLYNINTFDFYFTSFFIKFSLGFSTLAKK